MPTIIFYGSQVKIPNDSKEDYKGFQLNPTSLLLIPSDSGGFSFITQKCRFQRIPNDSKFWNPSDLKPISKEADWDIDYVTQQRWKRWAAHNPFQSWIRGQENPLNQLVPSRSSYLAVGLCSGHMCTRPRVIRKKGFSPFLGTCPRNLRSGLRQGDMTGNLLSSTTAHHHIFVPFERQIAILFTSATHFFCRNSW